MPFTFSHPAAIIPFTFLPKRWFSLTGLAIGSMIPDFEYFIRMSVHGHYGHTLWGILWFDLPLSLLVAFVFHTIVRDSLIDNLPAFVRSRISEYKGFDWRKHFRNHWPLVTFSVLLGTGTHVFWDSFTHYDGYFAGLIPFLQYDVSIFNLRIPVCHLLQHSSTLIGGILILFMFFKLPVQSVPQKKVNLRYWGTFASVCLTIIGLVTFSLDLNYRIYGQAIITGISACMSGLILTPLIIRSKPSVED